MRTLRQPSRFSALPGPIVLAAGFFDGMHRGHQRVLAGALARARRCGGQAWVLTFDRHPLALCPECLAKLCWCLGVRPEEHLRRVSEFCAAQGLETERQAAAAALKALPAPVPEPAATSRE